MYRERLGDRIRHERERRGWTHGELARRSERSRVGILRLESGQGDARADLDSLAPVARAFGWSLGELLWPVIEPDNAQLAEAAAAAAFEQERHALHEEIRQAYTEALDSKRAGQLYPWIAMLAANSKDEALQLVTAMIEAAAVQALKGQSIARVDMDVLVDATDSPDK